MNDFEKNLRIIFIFNEQPLNLFFLMTKFTCLIKFILPYKFNFLKVYHKFRHKNESLFKSKL